MGVTVVAVSAIGGALALHVFYRAVEFRWPSSYIGSGDAGLYRLLSSPGRYLIFRMVPVYSIAVVCAVSSSRLGASGSASAFGVVLLHLGATNLRSIVRDLRQSPVVLRHRVPVVLIRTLGLLGMIGCAWLASVTTRQADEVVPSLDDITNGLFTGIAAGVIGAYIMKATSTGGDVEQLLRRSRRQIDDAHWQLARQAALRHGADPRLVRAVMLVENLQRPPWIRRLERLKGLLIPAGTYGVMQVASPNPISDEESIQLAAQRLSGESVWNDSGGLHYQRVTDASRRYNPDPGYPDLLRWALILVEEWKSR